jgi:glycosyltransferase involved in cell wall biosynthesis
MTTKLAFVIPWYGPNIPGGAEALTRRTAEHLYQAGMPVEILTTCIRDIHGDWNKNFHKPGLDYVNGLPVRRFPVMPRDRQAFDQVNWRLMNNLPIMAEQEKTFIEQMMCVPELYKFIRAHQQEYLFIFVPYMFATTYYGAKLCPERSLIIPCLHDESYVYLDIYKEVIPRARGLIYLTNVEVDLAERVFGESKNGQIRRVLGCGIDTDISGDGARFRHKYKLGDTPFVLYAGRRDSGKNTPLLLDYWRRYCRESGRKAKLVLIGSGQMSILPEEQPYILDLGFVPVQDKYDSFAAANLFCLPSINESFSIVIMESWLMETPVLVHGRCAVTRQHCQLANGGLYFDNYDEFSATVDYLLDHPETAATLGKQGRRYVLDNFQWPAIIQNYKNLIYEVLASG